MQAALGGSCQGLHCASASRPVLPQRQVCDALQALGCDLEGDLAGYPAAQRGAVHGLRRSTGAVQVSEQAKVQAQ